MQHKIGMQLYCVHKSYIDKSLQNGVIVIGKVKTYCNIDGEILPVIREVGARREIGHDTHYVYDRLDDAIDAISTKRVKKK